MDGTNNHMFDSFKDYSWIQDFEADFLWKFSLKILNYNQFSDLFTDNYNHFSDLFTDNYNHFSDLFTDNYSHFSDLFTDNYNHFSDLFTDNYNHFSDLFTDNYNHFSNLFTDNYNHFSNLFTDNLNTIHLNLKLWGGGSFSHTASISFEFIKFRISEIMNFCPCNQEWYFCTLFYKSTHFGIQIGFLITFVKRYST